MGYSVLKKLSDNLEAVRLALAWRPGQTPNAAQAEALQRYSGFGGIKAVLYPAGDIQVWKDFNATEDDLRLHPRLMELHSLLQSNFDSEQYRQVVQSLRNSVLTAFYTPPVVPQTLYSVLKENNIAPRRIYEPSSGAGVFLSEAVKAFPELERITAVEKDLLTAKVLQALSGGFPVETTVHSMGFEETPSDDDGQYDLVVSNIPFGNFAVHDPSISSRDLVGKIHNYFFAKGIEKTGDGGLLAYITTDSFLNSPSNQKAREHLFGKADFISLTVLLDNLMKDTGNTEAPSHLLIVQKNEEKNGLSADEQLLVNTVALQNGFGDYPLNAYLHHHPQTIAGDEIKPGKNQYGHANQRVWQHGEMDAIAGKLTQTIEEGISKRFDHPRFQQSQTAAQTKNNKPKLTFLSVPESISDASGMQLGLFDTSLEQTLGRAQAYITPADAQVVQPHTARIASQIRTKEQPEHESIVLVTAKTVTSRLYVYKLYSNVEEIRFPATWTTAGGVAQLLNARNACPLRPCFLQPGRGGFPCGSRRQRNQAI